MIRIECTVPNASENMNGVWYGEVPGTRGQTADGVVRALVSEPVDEDVAERLFGVSGFSRCTRGDDVLELVDAAIEKAKADASAGPASGNAVEAALVRSLDEQRDSNVRMAAELQRLKVENAEIKANGGTVDQAEAVSTLTTRLATETTESGRLRDENTALAGELDVLRRANKALTTGDASGIQAELETARATAAAAAGTPAPLLTKRQRREAARAAKAAATSGS